MRRRDFIVLLGGFSATPFCRARAQSTPVIGFLHPSSADSTLPQLSAFREGLKEAGYSEGQNVRIEYRWGEGRSDRFPQHRADLVRRNVALIVAAGGTESAMAAKAATATIPIIFNTGFDP